MYDPLIRIEIVAVVLGKSYESVNRMIRMGRMPPKEPDDGLRGWRLSTLRGWNPPVAERIENLLKTPYLPPAA